MSERDGEYTGVTFRINRDESGKIIDGLICTPVAKKYLMGLEAENSSNESPQYCTRISEQEVFKIASGEESPTRLIAQSIYDIVTGASVLFEMNVDPQTGEKK
jgi:hypothetical protein